MGPAEELAQQNRVLRERIARLESAAPGQADPVLRALIEHATAFLNVVTPDGRFLATGRVSEAFGSVIGRSVFEFTDPSQHATMRAAFARACETAQPVGYESIGYGENGEPDHTYAVRAIPVIEGGVVSALVLVPLDISERVRLERSLVESEQSMRLAVDAAHMGLWRWDVVRDEVTWDARMLEVFDVPMAPANYDLYIRLIHPDDRTLIERVVREVHETGIYPTFEHRLAPRAGREERWVLAAGKGLKDASGRVVVILGGVLDITAQKRLASQLQRAERVEALGQLTAGMAHNFNNLLASILPNVECALHEASERQRPLLTAALDASLQARELVKGLLSLAGRRGPQPKEPSDPNDVVTRLDALCRLTLPREIALMTRVAAESTLVAMAASELEQVLLNLLFNARDALLDATIDERTIRMLVDRVTSAAGEVQTRIRVIDNGIGMTETVRAQIFTPFFTTKPPHRGSGLGLANALSRVRDAHGRLECESAPGVGTVFTLFLPQAPAASSTAAQASAPEGASQHAETILVVDDEPMVRDVVARVLRNQRYEVLESGSAREARKTLEQQGARVHLIILDQSMPVESGLEALPSLGKLCAAPIVLFTGLATERPAGVAAVLEKPARPTELLRTVRRVLDEASGQ